MYKPELCLHTWEEMHPSDTALLHYLAMSKGSGGSTFQLRISGALAFMRHTAVCQKCFEHNAVVLEAVREVDLTEICGRQVHEPSSYMNSSLSFKQ
jgi:hypothetical protein